MKRIAAAILALGLIVLVALFASTPSVRTAPQIVRAQVLAHVAVVGGEPPPRFVTALTATEDQRFFWAIDPGVDPVAVLRVAYESLAGQRGDLGGSTITQQLAKMLYGPSHPGLRGKFDQVMLALKLSFAFPKRQILQMYSEVAYYGDGYYGLRAASCGYFGKPPQELSWRQAATLAGAVNAPSADDPRRHRSQSERRTAHVFDRLVAVGALSRPQAEAEQRASLGLVPRDKAGCPSGEQSE